MATQSQSTELPAQLNTERSRYVLQTYTGLERLLVWAEWALLIIAVVLLIAATSGRPSGGLVLALLAASFVARLIRTGRITRSTPIDIPLVLFLVSALVAFWVAADRTQATYRLLLIMAAVGLFYSIVNSRPAALATFADVFVIAVAAAGIYLASEHDWSGTEARFAIVRRLGLLLNQFIPEFVQVDLHWNVIRNGMAAVLGIAMPIAVARTAAGFRGNRPLFARRGTGTTNWLRVSLMAVTAVMILIGLVMTESRMPWLAYLAIAGLAVWWRVAGRMSSWLSIRREHLFLAVAAVALIAISIAFAASPEQLSWLPGPNNTLRRAEIFSQAWRLAEDTPFTGGGLAQFPALYSTYIQVIPHAHFLAEDSGNSAYLNVLVEQGWLGLIALATLLATSVYTATGRLAAERSWKGLEIAGAVGLAFVVFYGLAHDMLVATRTIPFLLVPIGMVLARPLGSSKAAGRSLVILAIAVAGVALTVAAAIVVLQPVAASWQANLGAVEMAKVELAEWPTGAWDDGSRVGELARTEGLFSAALGIDPTDRTANHRMGLIRMLERDFDSAIGYFEIAYLQDPEHRGIQKALGQSYAWTGELEEAYRLLAPLPESRGEMGVYQRWWSTQNRPDLANSATRMVALLDQGGSATLNADS